MKKFILMFLITTGVTCLCASLAACAVNGGDEHNWDKKWSHDERGHWHECLDDCGQITGYDSHAWEFKSTIDYPTCSDAGLGIYACKVCDEERQDIIEATGDHFWVVDDRLEPTCYSKGFLARTCALCDTSEQVEIPATQEHTFVKSLWAPVGEEGHGHPCAFRDQGCTAISDTESHNKKSKPTTIQPTDFDDGSISYDCIECGYKMDVVVLPATHLPVSIEITSIKRIDNGKWGSYVQEPELIKLDEGEYSVTLFWNDISRNKGEDMYMYKVTCTATYQDGSTEELRNYYSTTTINYGMGAYLIDSTTGEQIEYANDIVANTIRWWSDRFKCMYTGEYRVAFVFMTGRGSNRVQRLAVYCNITVVDFNKTVSALSAPIILNTLTTAPVLYIENGFRKRNEV